MPVIFVANIWKRGYQDDAIAEVEKIVSHNGMPLVVTNYEDMRYDNLSCAFTDQDGVSKTSQIPVIKLPAVEDTFLLPLHISFVIRFVERLRMQQIPKTV